MEEVGDGFKMFFWLASGLKPIVSCVLG